ncbi:FAD-dependent cmnm(5)s(2)U34 oxidoreductase [Vandammella animalimorsus]|uniref:tRNA 5-methylaminomethyl-2-thiouridine biosynthesis bifunctional protein MnmC n=1 Tax=Vandammella animalimorsus TaxID=2029117 RepID=A0A2A2B034_9BURK|nr:FAD-dependent cmnm(5)s(2)U34 oxidoreductase [Vandammella animalimorsus]
MCDDAPPSCPPPEPTAQGPAPSQPPAGPTVQWLADGSPYSPQFGDRYHSHAGGGLAQAQGCFLQGCGLPEAWRGQRQWRILETGFGLGLNFLATWQAWRDDPQRCDRLHFISTEAWPVSAQDLLAAARSRYPQLLPLAEELALQYRDLHSGIHRLSFEQQRVHLTLAIGSAHEYLRSEGWQADSVYLDGFSPAKNPDIWSPAALRAVARCCIPGHTQLATWCVASPVRQALAQCGFSVQRVPGIPPKKHNLRARYAPPWPTRARNTPAAAQHLPWPAPLPVAWHSATKPQAIVIGAGLAGASMAHALAERGWRVNVLEQADAAAQGASGLPVGLFAPHISPDDAPLSRLSRAGLRSTRRLAARLLRHGQDWQDSGVLEHRIGKRLGLPAHGACTTLGQPPAEQPAVPHIASQASHPALASQRLAAGLDWPCPDVAQAPQQSEHPAVWHSEAGWIRPAALVQRLLQHPHITLHTGCQVQAIAPIAPSSTEQPPNKLSSIPALQRWQVMLQTDAAGSDKVLETDCLVIAAAFDSLALAQPWASAPLPLNPVRGQVVWGVAAADAPEPAWPAWPVNGKGSFVHFPAPPDCSAPEQIAHDAHATSAAQALRLWVSGATFEREAPLEPPSAEAVAAAWQQNRQRLAQLMPAIGPALAQHLFEHNAQGPQRWGAVRCTTPDRTPCYGPVSPQAPNVLLATGLGARGLTLAALCADILCALLHDEPLPVARQLAALVLSSRLPMAANAAKTC